MVYCFIPKVSEPFMLKHQVIYLFVLSMYFPIPMVDGYNISTQILPILQVWSYSRPKQLQSHGRYPFRSIFHYISDYAWFHTLMMNPSWLSHNTIMILVPRPAPQSMTPTSGLRRRRRLSPRRRRRCSGRGGFRGAATVSGAVAFPGTFLRTSMEDWDWYVECFVGFFDFSLSLAFG